MSLTLDRALYQKSHLYFLAFFACMLAAFWFTDVPSLVPYLPLTHGQPNAPILGFLLADVMLVGLSVWDWVSHKRWNVFPFALVVLLAYHWSFLYLYQFAIWQRFCAWFVGL